ncbi:MAG TPA: hypothetical protein VEG30_06740 [Terriglobales bacterium]|nr:hypothetical protein [Terriglobales bacterium]
MIGVGSENIPSKPEWRRLFEAAVLEIDQTQLAQKIEAARAAIDARVRELTQNGLGGTEEYALRDALLALNDLQAITLRKVPGNSH